MCYTCKCLCVYLYQRLPCQPSLHIIKTSSSSFHSLLCINDSLSYSDSKFCHKRSSNIFAAPEFIVQCNVKDTWFLLFHALPRCRGERATRIRQAHSREQGHQRAAEVTASLQHLLYRKVAFNLNSALLSFSRYFMQ